MKKTILLLGLVSLCPPALAQSNDSLIVLFNSGAGLQMALGGNADLWQANDRRDANNDGFAELAMYQSDVEGRPQSFLVLTQAHTNRRAEKYSDITSHFWNDSLLYFKWDDLRTLLGGNEPTSFLGFYPFLGSESGLKDLVFRTTTGVAVIGATEGSNKRRIADAQSFVVSADQVTIADLNEDGVPELLVRNFDTKTVQVWGRSSMSTAVVDDIRLAAQRLFQNYPNPFRTSTVIPYEIDSAGSVTMTVFDSQGRRLRILVDEAQSAGTYEVEWDGRDSAGQPVASGSYFYRLRLGETATSKQTIRVK